MELMTFLPMEKAVSRKSRKLRILLSMIYTLFSTSVEEIHSVGTINNVETSDIETLSLGSTFSVV